MPFVMPPSSPPARFVGAAEAARRDRGGWRRGTRWPGRPTCVPSPISAARIAWMPQSAPASRASSRRSGWTWLPRPDGQPGRVDLERAADGAAPRLLRVDERAPLGRDRLVVHVQVGRLDRGALLGVGGRRLEAARARARSRRRARRPRRRSRARSCFASEPSATVAAVERALARSSTSRASSSAVLERAGEIGVAGAHLGELPAAARVRRDEVLPVLVVLVPDDERDGRAERHAAAQAGEELRLVLLDLLPPAAAVALLAPRAGRGSPRRSRSRARRGSPRRWRRAPGPCDSPAVR